jgi:hypothetical protein
VPINSIPNIRWQGGRNRTVAMEQLPRDNGKVSRSHKPHAGTHKMHWTKDLCCMVSAGILIDSKRRKNYSSNRVVVSGCCPSLVDLLQNSERMQSNIINASMWRCCRTCPYYALHPFCFMDNDQQSLFEYEPDPDRSYAPDSFNLTQLNRAVCKNLRQPCQLRKLGEGSFHKVDSL